MKRLSIYLLACGLLYAQGDVLTQHNDNQRTGHYTAETILTPAFVKGPQFRRLPDITLLDPTDQIYAQPLYVHALQIPSVGTRNVLFVATEHNVVYAFDADHGGALLWMRSLSPPASVDSLNPGGYDLIYPVTGITSTPVIDLSRNRLYVVSMAAPAPPSGNGPGVYSHTLYDLDLTTGNTLHTRVISGFVPGTGDGSVKGMLTFDPSLHRNRASLLLQNDTVYVAFAGGFERFPYRGWVFAYNVASLAPAGVYATNTQGTGGGIWQSGNGLAGDGSAIFASAGQGVNEYTDAYAGPVDSRGSSVIKLAPNLNEMDWFTPFNQQCLDTCDLDLASSGPVLLPGLQRLVAAGKEGRMYVLDSTNLGHGPVPQDSQIAGCFKATEDQYNAPTAHRRCESFTCTGGTWNGEVIKYPHIHGSPVVWTQQYGSQYRIYVQGERDRLKAFQFQKGAFRDKASLPLNCFPLPGNAAPIDESNEISPSDTMPGGILALSSNQQQAGTAILWVSVPRGGEGEAEEAHTLVTGVLRAYDASNLKNKLWEQTLDTKHYVKFVPPTIADGKVYMAGIGRVAVFGQPSSFTSVKITMATGNDNARKDSEIWATFPGEPPICLKPSNNAGPDAVCNNGGSATDQNGQQEWANFTTSIQTFALKAPTILDGSTVTIRLIEHDSNGETDDNWDIQGITLTGIDSKGNATLLLNMSNPPKGDNCMARLKGSPNPSSVTYNLSASNPSGSNMANPTFGPTPPGRCPQ
jgi:hypothetical protein